MAIRCGSFMHPGPTVWYHDTVDQVRRCCAGLNVPGTPDGPARPAVIEPPSVLVEVTEGMWKLGDKIIKVQIAHHGSGRLYGKELVITGPKPENGKAPHEWMMLTGAVRMLREQGGQKMTLEEAVQFGKLYGFCCSCGTILTLEKSIEAGIGPIRAGKF